MPEDLEQDERQILELTAWFHDAVYRGTAQDEQDSARLAEARLYAHLPGRGGRGAPPGAADHHTPPAGRGLSGQMFSDADLEVLARPPAAYQRYTAAIAEEYSHLPQKDFAAGRSQILQALLDKEQIFATPLGLQRWEASPGRTSARKSNSSRAGAKTLPAGPSRGKAPQRASCGGG